MNDQNCANCYYCEELRTGSYCKKNPPSYNAMLNQQKAMWPIVLKTDWCGSWKAVLIPETLEAPRVSSTIACSKCGLSWTAHEGTSWLAVVEAKKSHDCIPTVEAQ